MKSIFAEWSDYNTTVLPPDAGATQRLETRRAFYAGAQCMLTLISILSAEAIDDDDGAAAIEKLNQELLRFNEDVKAGRA